MLRNFSKLGDISQNLKGKDLRNFSSLAFFFVILVGDLAAQNSRPAFSIENPAALEDWQFFNSASKSWRKNLWDASKKGE